MHTQSVCIGEIMIDAEPITLRAEIPEGTSPARIALLKYKLAYLLDTRFRPAAPETPKGLGLTVEEVAEQLHCRCLTVLRMIKRGDLHPVSDEDGDLYFDPNEIAGVRNVPKARR